LITSKGIQEKRKENARMTNIPIPRIIPRLNVSTPSSWTPHPSINTSPFIDGIIIGS